MDKLEYLIGRFHKIKNTYPNLANLWINYLTIIKNKLYLEKITIKHYHETIEKASYTLKHLCNDDYKDFTRENILTLLMISLQ